MFKKLTYILPVIALATVVALTFGVSVAKACSAAPPTNTALPQESTPGHSGYIQAIPFTAQTTVGTWTTCHDPITYSYQWSYSWAYAPPGNGSGNISGATHSSYTVSSSFYVGDWIEVTVTACNEEGCNSALAAGQQLAVG
jgi:hypothetical protein